MDPDRFRAPATHALLFDLGHVVVDIDFELALQHWSRHSRLSLAQLRERFRMDEPYQRHETGDLAAEGYFDHLRHELALECDNAAVAAGFNAIFRSEITPTVQLLDAARQRVPCYAISNTNAVHIAAIARAFPALLPRFARVFTSHEIGHRKPHAAAFQHVLDAIGVAAPQVLLFDDLEPNIEGARALGLQAVLVRSSADVSDALLRRGLVTA